MSTAHYPCGNGETGDPRHAPVASAPSIDQDAKLATQSYPRSRPLHRIGTARQQQGISLRSAARRLGITVREARFQECETTNLSLAELYRWQQLLEVPIANLLVDLDGPLSEPVLKRARLLKLMKTAGAIAQQSKATSVRRLADMLVDQLIELMPELEGVSPWHVVGQRRTLAECGRIAEQTLPDSLFVDPGC